MGAGCGQTRPMWRPLTSLTHYVSNPWPSYFPFSPPQPDAGMWKDSRLNSHYKSILDHRVFSWVHLTHHGLLLQGHYCLPLQGHYCWQRPLLLTLEAQLKQGYCKNLPAIEISVTKMIQLIKQAASFTQILSQNLYQPLSFGPTQTLYRW